MKRSPGLQDIASAVEALYQDEDETSTYGNVLCFASFDCGKNREGGACRMIQSSRATATTRTMRKQTKKSPQPKRTGKKSSYDGDNPTQHGLSEETFDEDDIDRPPAIPRLTRRLVRTQTYGKICTTADEEYFFAFRKHFDDGTHQDFQLGSCCFLLPENPSEEMYIAQIETIVKERRHDDVYVRCRWFRRSKPTNRLHLTDSFDVNSTDAIEGPCDVFHEYHPIEYFCESRKTFGWFH